LLLVVGLTADPTMQISGARRGEMSVHLGEGPELGHGDEEVPPRVADQVLDVALLVAAPDPAEVMVEQVVRFEAQELTGQVPAGAHHLLHRDRRVVI
jgi:hypothetical protein